MNEILNFVKEVLMLKPEEKTPVGLCAFESPAEQPVRKIVKKIKKRELRLSELME